MDDVRFEYRGKWMPMTNRNMYDAIDHYFPRGIQVWFNEYMNLWGDRLELGHLYVEDKELGKINLTVSSWEWVIEEVMRCEIHR